MKRKHLVNEVQNRIMFAWMKVMQCEERLRNPMMTSDEDIRMLQDIMETERKEAEFYEQILSIIEDNL